MRVLVVEDDEDIAQVLQRSLRLDGYEVKLAGDGVRALEEADLPDDTRLWAALQRAGGGTWGGCVYDVDAIVAALARATA